MFVEKLLDKFRDERSTLEKDEIDTTRAYSSKTSKRVPAKKDKKNTLEKRKRTTSKGAPDEKDEKDEEQKEKQKGSRARRLPASIVIRKQT